MSPRRPAGLWQPVLLVLGVVLAIAGAGPTSTAAAAPSATAAAPTFDVGVLIADPSHARTDYAAGVRVVTLELKWSAWEPINGTVDRAYRQERRATADLYRAAGFRVAVDVGLQYAPSWLLALPDGQLHDQAGTASGTPNYFFSADVRAEAASYLRAVVRGLGPVTSYRVGLSPSGETLYPESPANQWWAFDRLAQGQTTPRVAAGPVSPLPGWVPGTATYQGAPVQPAQVRAWYDWYLGASVAAHEWEMTTFRTAGFTGVLQLVMPGSGANPWVYAHRLASGLQDQPYDAFHTLNTGAVWSELLERLTPRSNVAVDISSVYDGSGSPRGDDCQPGDAALDYHTYPQIDSWSSTRWLSYLARREGYATVVGESTGNNSAADLAQVVRQTRSCGLSMIQWAWDYQLYDGVHASIEDLRRVVGA